MFGTRYFGGRYFGARFFGHRGFAPAVIRGDYFGQRYFPRRYWGQGFSAVDSAYNGARFFGPRYFGSRYFSPNVASFPFELTITQGITGTGTGTLSWGGWVNGSDWPLVQTGSILGVGVSSFNATPSYNSEDWPLTPPLGPLLGVGVSSFSATLEFGFPPPTLGRYFGKKYWGSRYYGPRYWGTFGNWNLEITQGITGVGVATYSAALGLAIGLDFTPLQAIGTSSFSAPGLSYNDPVPTGPFTGQGDMSFDHRPEPDPGPSLREVLKKVYEAAGEEMTLRELTDAVRALQDELAKLKKAEALRRKNNARLAQLL